MSILKLKNEKWQVSTAINGKRVRRNFESKAQAKEFENSVRLAKLGISGDLDKRYSIADAFANYLEIDSQQKNYASQRADRRFLCIAEHFFKGRKLTLLEEVGFESLQLFELWLGQPQKCGSILKPAWSQASIARHCKTLKGIFRKAYHSGKIGRNPAEIWRIRGGRSVKRRPMTFEEFAKVLAIAPEWYMPILLTLRLTGARPVAIAELTWADVDFERATLTLRSRKGGRDRLKTIIIPMLPELMQLITRLLNEQQGFPIVPSIFLKRGEPVSAAIISRTGSRLIKRAKLSGVVLYGLRHSMATDLLNAGVDSNTVRRILGHSDPRQLQEYTSHAGTEQLEKALTLVRGKKPTQE